MRLLQQYKLTKLVSDKWSPEELAGQCIAVNMNALDAARQVFDGDIELVLGRVYVREEEVFAFEPEVIQFHKGDGTKRVNLHCWLNCPSDGYLVDLTLVPTLRDKNNFDSSFIPEGTVFLYGDAAQNMDIKHKPLHRGREAVAFINKHFRR